jgi:transcriptional regulator with XRE-family HTH domain
MVSNHYRMAPSPHALGFNGAAARELRAEAAKKNITDGRLAELAGMSPTVLGRYLRCERGMSLETIEKLADALGIDGARLVMRAWEERGGE